MSEWIAVENSSDTTTAAGSGEKFFFTQKRQKKKREDLELEYKIFLAERKALKNLLAKESDEKVKYEKELREEKIINKEFNLRQVSEHKKEVKKLKHLIKTQRRYNKKLKLEYDNLKTTTNTQIENLKSIIHTNKLCVDNFLNFEKKSILEKTKSNEEMIKKLYKTKTKNLDSLYEKRKKKLDKKETNLIKNKEKTEQRIREVKIREKGVKEKQKVNQQLNNELETWKKKYEIMKNSNYILKEKQTIEQQKMKDKNDFYLKIINNIYELVNSKDDRKLEGIRGLCSNRKNFVFKKKITVKTLKTGHGKLLTGKPRNWKDRYFTLNDNYQFHYWENNKKNKILGTINLIDVVIKRDKNKQNVIYIEGKHFKNVYSIKFSEDVDEWFDLLNFFNKKVISF